MDNTHAGYYYSYLRLEEVAASVTKDQHLTCLLSVDPYLNVDAIERLYLINIYTIIVYEGLISYI